jgi:hypothetical protein
MSEKRQKSQKKTREKYIKRYTGPEISYFGTFFCPISTKRGGKTNIYIILQQFFSLPGPIMSTPTLSPRISLKYLLTPPSPLPQIVLFLGLARGTDFKTPFQPFPVRKFHL